jgi:putative Ca2+/H+ antiporter (TMEM165/GDT1 family)
LPDPRAEYSKRLEGYAQIIAAKNRRHVLFGNAKLAMIVAEIAGVWLVLAKDLFPPYWLIVPAAAYLILAIAHEYVLRAKKTAETASDFYHRGIARMDDRWSDAGSTGENFRSKDYLYAEDLDIFGKGSLFQLLSQARLPM